MRSAILLFCSALVALARAEVGAIYGQYGPSGSVANTRPQLSWRLTPTGGGRVTRVEMNLNAKPVPAQYNEKASSVEFTPSADLDPGLYNVACRVTLEGQVVARQEWSFEVGTGEDSSFAAAAALDELNLIRKEIGLAALPLDDRLARAAAAHSSYQWLAGVTGHYEESSQTGFTGRAPWDRAKRFGFPGSCYEGASGGQPDPRSAVRMLFDAPYHRIAFLQPGAPAVGVGFERGFLTVDYGISEQEGPGMSPAPGQTGVSLAWDGNETPNPLRLHDASGRVGYPIVFSWFSPRLGNARIQSMTLEGPDGNQCPAHLNTPENDAELRFAAVLIPRRPLSPRTTYRVDVRGQNDRGETFARSWSFTTR